MDIYIYGYTYIHIYIYLYGIMYYGSNGTMLSWNENGITIANRYLARCFAVV